MRGVWTALVTPFLANQNLDWTSFEKILRYQIDAGVRGVILCGSTGETTALTLDEKKQLVQRALELLKGSQVQLFVGAGTGSFADTLEWSRWVSEQGVDGLMVVTPPYVKPSQAGLRNYFETLANAVTCKIMLYHVPSRTGSSLEIETIVQLAQHPHIRALKEASGNLHFTAALLAAFEGEKNSLDILSGDDLAFLPLLSIGAIGVVSVASHLFPSDLIQLQKCFEQGNVLEAQRIHQRYYPLFRDLFIESNPVPVKNALAKMGLCEAWVRPPLAPLLQCSATQLAQSMRACLLNRGEE